MDATAQVQHQKLSLDVTVPADGSMYIYMANESDVSAATAVFFDEFVIIHKKSTKSLRVTEVTDYDPFGFILEGTRYVDEGQPVNRYGYQGDYAEFDELIGWNRFSGRGNYDPRLGRWHSVDPKAYARPMHGPYVAMGNDPIVNLDGGYVCLRRNSSSRFD